LGLSSVSNRAKSKGIGKSLYRAFFDGAAEWARSTHGQVAWWFHTATPVTANAIWNMVPYTIPRQDGSFTESDRHLVPQGSHQKRPTVVTSKPANGRGLGQDCFTP